MERLKAWMTGSPTSIEADASLDEALVLMCDRGFRHLPVVDRGGRVIGVLAFEDLRAALSAPVSLRESPSAAARSEAREGIVADVMSEAPVVARAQEGLAAAADRMADARVGCLPVVDEEGTLVGLFSETDALRALGAAASVTQRGDSERSEAEED